MGIAQSSIGGRGVSLGSLRLLGRTRLDHIEKSCPLRLREIVKWAKGYSTETPYGGLFIVSQLQCHILTPGSRASTRKQYSFDVLRKPVHSFWRKGELGNLYVSARRPKKTVSVPASDLSSHRSLTGRLDSRIIRGGLLSRDHATGRRAGPSRTHMLK